MASHDLRAPLRAIDQLAQFIEEDAADALSEDSREDLGQLRKRVFRLEALLKSLLDYSRVGRDESVAVPIDVAAMAEEIVELYVPTDRFTVEITLNLPEIVAPRPAAELIIRNLLMNAVKHHDRERGWIRVSGERTGCTASIIVSDDGPGIPERYRQRVFEIFQTLKPRDDVEGSGMGLALVKKTMETMSGTVEILPNEGRGTSFKLTWFDQPQPMKAAS